MIPFADWRPDLADLNTGDFKNVIPAEDGYRSLPSMQVQSDAIDNYCRGAISSKAADTTAYNYAGDEKNLYAMTNNAWSEVSNGGNNAYASLGDKESWEFAVWGEKIIAVGGANASDPVPQVVTMGGGDFADLGGTPPRARHIGIVRNFVVLGNLYESAAAYPSRLRWSGLNDETSWTVDPATQSDYQDLLGGGWIQSVQGGEYGVILKERSIWRMSYIGPPKVFAFDEIPGIGTPAPNGVIQRGDNVIFYGQDGFYVTSNAQSPQPIGRHILDRYVKSDLDLEYAYRMVGAEDKERQVFWWIYPGQGHTSGMPNKCVIFDYKTGKWSYAELDLEWIYDSLGTSTDLDSLPAAGYTNLDTMTISLDSDVWKGGAIIFGAFDSDHKLNTLSGTAMAAELTTQEQALGTGNNRAQVTRIRPLIDGGDVTVQVGTRNDLADSVTWSGTLSERPDGSIPIRHNARYHRFRVTTSGDFNRALGVLPGEGGR